MAETMRNELPAEEEAIQLDQLLRVLWRRRWLLLAAPVTTALVTLLSFPFLTRLYEGTSLVRVRQPATSQSSLSSALSTFGVSLPPPAGVLSLKTVERLTKTRSTVRLALAMLRRRKDLPPLPRPLTEDDVLSAIRTKTLEPDLLEISVRFPEPRWAAAIANALADALSQRFVRDTTSDITRQRRYLERRLQSLRQQLAELDGQVADLKKRLGVTDLVRETEAIVRAYYDAQLEQVTLQAQWQGAKETAERFRQRFAQQQPFLPAEVLRQDPAVQEMRKQLVALEMQRADLLARYTPEHFAIRQLDATIQELRQSLAQRAKQLIQTIEPVPNPAYATFWQKWVDAETQQYATEARLQGVNRLLDLLRRRIASLPDQQRQFATLIRQQQVTERAYADLLAQLETLRTQESLQVPWVTVADYAQPPKFPVFPRRLLTLILATLLGTFLGVALALFQNAVDPKVYDSQEMQKGLAAPLIVTLPRLMRLTDFLAWINSRDPTAETVRLLCTNLQLAQDDQKPLRCLLVTSPNHGEGKTFIATALAAAFAQSGRNTVLVSWGTKEGQPHPLLGILPDAHGTPPKTTPTKIRSLQWLAVADNGVDATEQLLSAVKQAKERADILVIDAPPVLSVADTSLLIPLTDGVIVVAEAGRTGKAELQKAKEQIQLAKGRIVAAVLNNAT
jgi:tyrosine-protein kinase Etk/Wzc